MSQGDSYDSLAVSPTLILLVLLFFN